VIPGVRGAQGANAQQRGILIVSDVTDGGQGGDSPPLGKLNIKTGPPLVDILIASLLSCFRNPNRHFIVMWFKFADSGKKMFWVAFLLAPVLNLLRTVYTRDGEPICYHGPHELCTISGEPQN